MGDYSAHISLADWENILSGTISYPIWHILVASLNSIIPGRISATLVSALFNTLTAIVIHYILQKELSEKNEIECCFLTFILMFVGPIYLSFFNKNYYLGQVSATQWHNPTQMAVRGISIFSSYLIYCCLSKNVSERDALINSLLIIISGFIKPSYVQILIPSLICCLFYEILKSKRWPKNGWWYLYFIIMSSLTLLLQYFLVFIKAGAGNSGIKISFFTVWRFYSPNVLISSLLSFAFPILVIGLLTKQLHIFKEIKNVFILFVFINAFLEYSFISETGARMMDGNFGWGLQLATNIIFLYSVIWWKNSKNLRNVGKTVLTYKMNRENYSFNLKYEVTGANFKYKILSCILGIHFICGVCYYLWLLFFATWML